MKNKIRKRRLLLEPIITNEMQSNNRSRRYFALRARKAVLAAILTFIGLLVLVWTSSMSSAKEKLTCAQGCKKCYDWCDAHNKTANSRADCHIRCFDYWYKNGSDAIAANAGEGPSKNPSKNAGKRPVHPISISGTDKGASPTPTPK